MVDLRKKFLFSKLISVTKYVGKCHFWVLDSIYAFPVQRNRIWRRPEPTEKKKNRRSGNISKTVDLRNKVYFFKVDQRHKIRKGSNIYGSYTSHKSYIKMVQDTPCMGNSVYKRQFSDAIRPRKTFIKNPDFWFFGIVLTHRMGKPLVPWHFSTFCFLGHPKAVTYLDH